MAVWIPWNRPSSQPTRLVERRGLHLFEQLLHHPADAHDLRRLLDQSGQALRVVGATILVVHRFRRDGHGLSVGTDHHDVVSRRLLVLCRHGPDPTHRW
jgi:hypothetical protein